MTAWESFVSWVQQPSWAETQINKALDTARTGAEVQFQAQADAVKIKAQGEAAAQEKGYSQTSNLFGTTTLAGSPQSGLPQNQGLNFLDLLKWNATNAPSSLTESGKDKASTLVVNTPTGESKTVNTPEGTVVTQKSQDNQPSALSDWLPLVIVIGIIVLAIVLIRK